MGDIWNQELEVPSLIFSKKDLGKLSMFLEEEKRKLAEENKKVIQDKGERFSEIRHIPELYYDFEFENNKSLRITDASIFNDEGGYLDIYKTISLRLSLSLHEPKRSISIAINEGHFGNRDKVYIKSDDAKWLEYTSKRISDLFASVRPQNNLVSRYWGRVKFLLNLASGWAVIYSFIGAIFIGDKYGLYRLELDKSSSSEISPIWYVIGISFVAIAIGSLITDQMEKYIRLLWPRIEFDFGPDHKKYGKNKRQLLFMVATLIILPILVNLLTNK